MPRSLPCPACSASLSVPDKMPEHVKTVRCPRCRKSMTIVKKSTKLDKEKVGDATATVPVATAPVATPAPPSFESDTLPDIDQIGVAGEGPEEGLVESAPVDAALANAALTDDGLVMAAAADDELVAAEMLDQETSDGVEQLEDIEVLDDPGEPEEEEHDEPERERDPLPGLLGHDEFLIKPRANFRTLYYEILDYKTRDVLGSASEQRMLFIGRQAARIVMHDELRDRELCTLNRPFALVKKKVEIHDHKECLLGTVAFRFVQILGATVYDWDGREWATIKGSWSVVPCMQIKDKAGNRLGKVTHETLKTGKMTFTFFSKGMSWYVKVGKRLRYDRDGKLLLLASALAYDMVRISQPGA